MLVRVYIARSVRSWKAIRWPWRHGNKESSSKILTRRRYAFPADGTRVDIVLNPLGVPSRMEYAADPGDPLGYVAGISLHALSTGV